MEKRQIPRLYRALVADHFRKYRQMLFLMGPRQVGKTTTSLQLADDWEGVIYLSWDNVNHRSIILQGPAAIAELFDSKVLGEEPPIVVLDEIHKMERWKDFLKGLYDSYPEEAHILVTGSACMDTFRKGGDSLMGRYFPYRVHPLSVAELLNVELRETEFLEKPSELAEEEFRALWEYGGYPDPFLSRDARYSKRWNRLRMEQLMKTDLRDLTRLYEYGRIEQLAILLRERAGQLVSYASLARQLQVNNHTMRNWISILEGIYYCFEVRPWSRKITRSILKEPKYYLYDWALCKDPGQRAENFIAQHLLKAVHFWTDSGFGDYDLHFLRDKSKREVDFLITKDDEPWMMVEVKYSRNQGISDSLRYFQTQLQPQYCFQVVIEMPYVDRSCFIGPKPLIVPARTFLSQLV